MSIEAGSVGVLSGLGPAQITQTELTSTQCDFFAPPVKDTSMLYSREVCYQPMQSVAGSGPFTFVIPGESGLFIDASSMRLAGKYQIKKVDPVSKQLIDLTKENKPSICNLSACALWDNIQCTMNGVNVSFVTTTNAHYKSYLETICTYGQDAAETHLSCSGFKMDTAGEFDSTRSYGQQTRAAWFSESQEVGFSSGIHSDVLSVDRLLLDNLPVHLTFTRNKDEFLLQRESPFITEKEPKVVSNDGTVTKEAVMETIYDENIYKLVLTELELRVKKIQLKMGISTEIERRLGRKERMRYPVTRTEIKTFNVPKGATFINWNNAVMGRMPYQMIAGIVEQKAYTGNTDLNGYNFQNFDMREFWFTVNNVELPTRHYRPSWKDLGYRRDFRIAQDNLFAGRSNTGTQITEAQFKNGSTLYTCDLSPDTCAGFHRHMDDSGTLSVTGILSKPQDVNLTLILYCAFHDEFQIDVDRQIYAAGNA